MPGDASRQNGKLGGRRTGSQNETTKLKAEIRAHIIARLRKDLDPILDALVARAKGSKYLVYRDDNGRFITLSARQAKRFKEMNLERLELWDRPADSEAIRQVLDRIADPPKATVELEAGEGMEEMFARLDRAKLLNRGSSGGSTEGGNS